VILWFVGVAPAVVWLVFSDPRFAFGLVALGALVPDLVDVVLAVLGVRSGGLVVGMGHSLVLAVGALATVMAVTRRGSAHRRRWLAVPTGMLLHLALDGMWGRPKTFWWPFLGTAFEGGRLPSLDRPLALLVVQEVIGVAALVWWRGQVGGVTA
jgi:hypothetical protein